MGRAYEASVPNAFVFSGTTEPALAVEGDLWYDETANLLKVKNDVGFVIVAQEAAPLAHKASHENAGADEISVAGLSGLLADAQTPLAHDGHAPTAGLTGQVLKKTSNTNFDYAWAAGGGGAAWGDITGTLSAQTDLQNALDAKQAADADLTTIAGLAATTDNFMVAAASAWASRTPAQAKTSLALAKGDVGLGNVDNTTDAGKPVSTAQQTALDLKANLAGPTFTGVPAAPTAAVGTNTTQLATTAYVKAMPLDLTAAPTDVTTNNASTAQHGLLPKLSGTSTEFLNGTGAFSTPGGGPGGGASLGLIVATVAGFNLN